MNKTSVYTINHILIGLILPFLLFSFKELIWFFIVLEIFFLFFIKDELFKLFRILFFTSFFALFIIHNIENGFSKIHWGFIWEYWIRILYMFLFISWLIINIRITHIISLMKQLRVKAEIIFIVSTTFVILKRIPIKIKQIFEIQQARGSISNNPLLRIFEYPKIVVPLIITLFRDIDYFVVNFYLLNNYELKNFSTNNKLFSSLLVSIVCICFLLILSIFNLWLK